METNQKKTIAIWALGILLLVVLVFWLLATRENNRLQNEIIEINNRLITQEEEKQTEILKATQQVDQRIRSLEEQYRKSRKDEEETISNFEPLAPATAAQFITDYARKRRAEDAARARDSATSGP